MANKFFAIGELNGVSLALADNVSAQSLHELASELTTFAQWEKAASEFSRGYAQGRDVKIESGLTQWSRLTKMAGLTKPKATSAAAAKKAAQRAAQKAAKGEEDVTAPAKGDSAARAVKYELNSTEAHLVSLLRTGKLTQCIEFLRAQIERTATM